jgi:hypothetical protein
MKLALDKNVNERSCKGIVITFSLKKVLSKIGSGVVKTAVFLALFPNREP